eukprot:365300-Chlamydomonas_euryale.AAC.19
MPWIHTRHVHMCRPAARADPIPLLRSAPLPTTLPCLVHTRQDLIPSSTPLATSPREHVRTARRSSAWRSSCGGLSHRSSAPPAAPGLQKAWQSVREGVEECERRHGRV